MEQARPDTGGSDVTAAARPPRSGRDRLVKLGFVVLTVAVVVVVYWTQRRGLDLPGWGDDLDAALAEAAEEKRLVLAFFVSSPPSDTARRLSKTTIHKNAEAIEQGRFVTVIVPVRGKTSEVAERYRIATLPTMLVLGPDGAEQNRREGFIGELDFRHGFLDRSQITPPPTSRPAR